MNYGIRYTGNAEDNYCGWRPQLITLTQFIEYDKQDNSYGKNYHQYVPSDYIFDDIISRKE